MATTTKRSATAAASAATTVSYAQSRKERRKADRTLKKTGKRQRTQHPQQPRSEAPTSTSHDNVAGAATASGGTADAADRPSRSGGNSNSSNIDIDIVKRQGSPSKQKKRRGASASSHVSSQQQQQRLIEQEDEEIRRLEARLGIKRSRNKKKGRTHDDEDGKDASASKNKDRRKLRKEYELEGYGGDFVDFLDSLDSLADNILQSETRRKRGRDEEEDDTMDDGSSHSSNGGGSSIEGSGDNDEKPTKLQHPIDDASEDENSEDGSRADDDDEDASTLQDLEEDDSVMSPDDKDDELEDKDDEVQGMSSREPLADSNDSESKHSGDANEDEDQNSANDEAMSHDELEGAEDDKSDDEDDSASSDKVEPDGTYRPARGQDIYGNAMPQSSPKAAPSAYVPPHLRNSNSKSNGKTSSIEAADVSQQHDPQQLRHIQSELNRAMNRLSEDTLVPTVSAICQVYKSYPNSVVNACLWDTIRRSCVTSNTSIIMVKLVPMYAAALAGVHMRVGDSAQLGEHCMEQIVVELWKCLEDSHTSADTSNINNSSQVDNNLDGDVSAAGMDKTPANLLLLLGYLYNYGVVHCTLVYGIVRRLIDGFPAALEVELLLLVLGHCGRALRSDDPAALKDIVLAVQAKQRDLQQQSSSANSNATTAPSSSSSSRVEYMIEAMMDLKNNKKRRQDSAHAERTAKMRKILGQVKRTSDSGGVGGALASGSTNASSLRITLDDILHAETRGRWWKVGASWVGNQVRYQSGADGTAEDGIAASGSRALASSNARLSGAAPASSSTGDEKLLALASKFRMNTDLRRAIFCVIMGSADCDDAFEKLVRGEMLKPRNEREAARVLMECCGGEKSFNKFYPHLAHRMCQFQPQCKFSFQLAFWDMFKQFEGMKVRKVANLAKLFFELVVVHRDLKLNVLKPIDMASPNDLAEPALIFLTIFFTHLMEHFDDAAVLTELFASGIVTKKRRRSRGKGSSGDNDDDDDDDDDSDDDSAGDKLDAMDEGDALRAGMLVFFVQVLKSSPDYQNKEGKFRRNLKAAIKACDVDAFF